VLHRNTHDVYVSLGSNMGDRIHHLNYAVSRLNALSLVPVHYSPVYETAPVGYLDQPDFLNVVAHLTSVQNPFELLASMLSIESERMRTRDVRYGPRTLDLDILLYDSDYICYNSLQIPHPRMWERAFVMVPLSTLSPARRGLGGQTVLKIADKLSVEGDVRYVGRFW